MSKLRLIIVTPEKPIASEEVDEVVLPGIEGQFGVLPEHTTLLSELGNGALTFKKGNQSQTVQIFGGFCEVRQNQVTVLADQAG
ncbi:MAG: ATP synthase F1 subunit epsilon [Deltaproteobacteria bacterium]|nr:ATP synthase F1 subunit epsilon [Deltaproteobacteria bacterium]